MQQENVRNGLDQSEFAMWRTLFSFALVDQVLTLEEQKLLSQYLSTVPFSQKQRSILLEDMKSPQNVESLYGQITQSEHRKRFCELARTLVWSKGDMDMQEKIILRRVSCIAHGDHWGMLRKTRLSDYSDNFHEQYERVGLLGYMQQPKIFESRV